MAGLELGQWDLNRVIYEAFNCFCPDFKLNDSNGLNSFNQGCCWLNIFLDIIRLYTSQAD